jgi:hypothetical protein
MIAAAVGALTLACAPAVTGATDAERGAIERIVCRMPQTVVRGVQVVALPADANPPPGSIGLRILVRGYGEGGRSVHHLRDDWEAAMAAGAIADGFRRLHLRPVIAFSARPLGTPATPLDDTTEPTHRLLPRVFESTERGPIGPPKTLGAGVGTWLRLDAQLDALDRRFRVHHRLARFAPFGKAPAVTVSASDLNRFLGGPGIVAYLKALRWTENRYDGALLAVRYGGAVVWTATVAVRPYGGAGCEYAVPRGGGRVDAADQACALAGAGDV